MLVAQKAVTRTWLPTAQCQQQGGIPFHKYQTSVLVQRGLIDSVRSEPAGERADPARDVRHIDSSPCHRLASTA
jgi:hypothetical protein